MRRYERLSTFGKIAVWAGLAAALICILVLTVPPVRTTLDVWIAIWTGAVALLSMLVVDVLSTLEEGRERPSDES